MSSTILFLSLNFARQLLHMAIHSNVILDENPQSAELISWVHLFWPHIQGSQISLQFVDGLLQQSVSEIFDSELLQNHAYSYFELFSKIIRKRKLNHELIFNQAIHLLIENRYKTEVYAEPENKNALQIANNAIAYAKKSGKKTVVVDTAGRLAVDDAMMQEIEELKKALNPSETLFVVDSMTGQDAVNTAKTFDERLDFDGVVLTKLDGDTRGGAAISIRHVVNKPIKFISTGEKMENLDVFHPDRMAQRILGMGDVISLVERAQQSFDEDEAKRLNAKMRQNNFNFDDFLSQLEQVKKMGNIKDLMGMIPGMGKALKGLDIDDDSFKPVEAIIRSMTPKERQNPDIIDGRRRKRLADGSGRNITEVNNLMKQFEDMRKMMKQMNKMGGAKAAMGKLMPPGMGKR